MVILHHLVQDIAIECIFVVHATLPFDERDERLLHASRGSPGSAHVDLERPSRSRTPSNPANSFNLNILTFVPRLSATETSSWSCQIRLPVRRKTPARVCQNEDSLWHRARTLRVPGDREKAERASDAHLTNFHPFLSTQVPVHDILA